MIYLFLHINFNQSNTTNGDFMYYYINCFFIYSIIGHIVETVFYTLGTGESGILYGYWTPVYGIGCGLILLFHNLILDKMKIKGIKKYVSLFFFGAVILTLVEWIGGTLIEKIFGTVFWSYDTLPLHIGDYISVEMAFIWGIASVLLVLIVKPPIDYFEQKIPRFITWIFILLFIIDISSTIYFKVL